MAENYRFFNSTTGDTREYQAAEFAEYFSRFISDGIFAENNQLGLRVSIGTGLKINVATGYAFIRGYLYHNDAELIKTIEAAHATLNRIDRVVVRLDELARTIKVIIKKGNPASNPVPPQVDADELSLAQVTVSSGASSVGVTDERMTDYAGQATLLIDVPLSDVYADIKSWKTGVEGEFQDWRTSEEAAFQSWLATLEGYLDENVAGNLINLIDEKMDKDKFIFSDQPADIEQMSEGDVWIQYE